MDDKPTDNKPMDDKPRDPSPHKGYDIVINGKHFTVENDSVTFDDVVDRAYPDGGRGPLISYTVLYFNAAERVTEGGLDEGDDVKIQNGTVFNVTRTDRS